MFERRIKMKSVITTIAIVLLLTVASHAGFYITYWETHGDKGFTGTTEHFEDWFPVAEGTEASLWAKAYVGASDTDASGDSFAWCSATFIVEWVGSGEPTGGAITYSATTSDGNTGAVGTNFFGTSMGAGYAKSAFGDTHEEMSTEITAVGYCVTRSSYYADVDADFNNMGWTDTPDITEVSGPDYFCGLIKEFATNSSEDAQIILDPGTMEYAVTFAVTADAEGMVLLGTGKDCEIGVLSEIYADIDCSFSAE
jgi:hypothetical protein